MPRYLHAIYCDDVRLEVGNKQSLMGIYASDLLTNELPVVLPKLCIVVNLITSIENPFKKLTVKILRDDEVLIEAPITDEQLNEPQSNIIENGDKDNPHRRIGMNFTLILSPFVIDKECTLRVRAETESGELKGAGLRIKLVQPPQTA